MAMTKLPPGFELIEDEGIEVVSPESVIEEEITGGQPTPAAPPALGSKLPEGFEMVDETATPEITEDTPWLDVLGQAAENAPKSAAAFGSAMKKAILNPRETIKGLADITLGLLEKIPSTDEQEDGPIIFRGTPEREEQSDLVVSHLRQRYGTLEGFKKAVAKDPVGVIADASTVLIPGGATLRGAGTITKLKGLTKAGEIVQKAGAIAEPIQASKEILAAPFRLIPKPVPSALYQRAVKFSTSPEVLTRETRRKIINVALDNKLMPTVKGLESLRDQINIIGNQVSALVDESAKSGDIIPTAAIFDDLGELAKTARKTGTPIDNLKAISNIKQQIIKANRKGLTVSDLQQLKQNIHRDLSKAYNSTTAKPWSVEAQKAAASGARTIIEELIPEVKQLNANQGVRLELNKHLERAASRIENRNLLSLGSIGTATAGAAAGDLMGLVGGASVGLLEFPRVKARIAIVLNELRKRNPNFKPSQAAISLGLTTPERVEGE